MASDASIYSLIRPNQPPADPMQQHAQMLQIGHLMDASQTNQLQRRKMESDFAEEESFKKLFAGGRSPTTNDVYGVSPSRGAAFQKAQLEAEEKRGTIQKNQMEVLNKSLSIHRDQLSSVTSREQAGQWIMGGFNDPALSPIMQRVGSPQEWLQRVPQDPSQFAQWKMQVGLGIEKFVEQTAPKIAPVNAGGTTEFRDTNALSPGFNANAPIAHTQTPESIASNATAREGQRLTDARERDVPLAASIAAARETGKETAVAQMGLPAVVSQAERGIKLIDELVGTSDGKGKAHPGMQSAVGVSLSKTFSPFWAPPGSDRRDFEARLDEIKGGAFMQAFQNLKGGGQITEIEGKKATQAITRMETAQSEREFVKAARDFQDVVRTGLTNAKQKASTNVGGVLSRNPDGSFSYGFNK